MKKKNEIVVDNQKMSLEQISELLSDIGYTASRDIERLGAFQNDLSIISAKITIEIEAV